MKMLILILAIIVLVIVLGNSGGERDTPIAQVNNTQIIERIAPVHVTGTTTPNGTYLPMITWREKKADGGTIYYARPVSE